MSTPLIIGDSIGVLMQRHSGGFEADAVVGRPPATVLAEIRGIAAATPEALRGRDVILSTGASNNPHDVELAREQIRVLKQAGAHVVMVGVGDRHDYAAADINGRLAQIAREQGVGFTGGLDPQLLQSDHVHPTPEGGKILLDKALQSLRGLQSPTQVPEKRSGQSRHFNKAQLIEAQHVLAGQATGGETLDVQRELKAEGFDIGKFGVDHDGVDGKAGKFTRTAAAAAIKKLGASALV
jgi:hypothetical protein